MPKEEITNKKSERDAGVYIPGLILIIIGFYFLLVQYGLGDAGKLWPLFILAPGAGFITAYLASSDKKKMAGLLIPGTITTLVAAFFFYLNYTDWGQMAFLWPIFPIIVSISFYAFYLAHGRQDRGILIPANILLFVGAVFLLLSKNSYQLWPIILIIIGLFIIFLPKRAHSATKKEQ